MHTEQADPRQWKSGAASKSHSAAGSAVHVLA